MCVLVTQPGGTVGCITGQIAWPLRCAESTLCDLCRFAQCTKLYVPSALSVLQKALGIRPWELALLAIAGV